MQNAILTDLDIFIFAHNSRCRRRLSNACKISMQFNFLPFHDIEVLQNNAYGISIWSFKLNQNDYINFSTVIPMQIEYFLN